MISPRRMHSAYLSDDDGDHLHQLPDTGTFAVGKQSLTDNGDKIDLSIYNFFSAQSTYLPFYLKEVPSKIPIYIFTTFCLNFIVSPRRSISSLITRADVYLGMSPNQNMDSRILQ